jgi:hypothetical protein
LGVQRFSKAPLCEDSGKGQTRQFMASDDSAATSRHFRSRTETRNPLVAPLQRAGCPRTPEVDSIAGPGLCRKYRRQKAGAAGPGLKQRPLGVGTHGKIVELCERCFLQPDNFGTRQPGLSSTPHKVSRLRSTSKSRRPKVIPRRPTLRRKLPLRRCENLLFQR